MCEFQLCLPFRLWIKNNILNFVGFIKIMVQLLEFLFINSIYNW